MASKKTLHLSGFLSKYRVDKSISKDKKVYTHTGLGSYLGCYNIPQDKRSELYDLIIKTVFSENKAVHLTEKSVQVKPLTVDLDFRYPRDYSERQHTKTHIEGIVKLYNQTIRKYADIPNDKAVRSFVFERNKPYPFKGNIKDGIHIIFPEVLLHTNIQHMIRKDIVKGCMNVFTDKLKGDLPLKNSPDDIVDEAIIDRNPWMLYGCSKPTLGRYELTHVYDDIHDDHEGDFTLRELKNHSFSHRDLIEMMSIQKENADRDQIPVRDEHRGSIDKLIQDRGGKKVSNRSSISRRNFISGKRKHRSTETTEETEKMIKEAKELVKILAPYRADDYKYWIEVGWCLFNIAPSLLDTWIEFSKQSYKYDEGECERLWNTFTDRDLGIGSLHRWAKLDDERKYNEIRTGFLQGHIYRSLSNTTQDVAIVVHEMFKHQFVCASSKGDLWYEFKNHRWHQSKHGISLKKLLGHGPNSVLNEYLKLISQYNIAAIEIEAERKDHALLRAKALTDLTYKLRDLGFKERIMKECAVMFYDPKFEAKLDSNPFLLGFENGVMDLAEGIFRDGRPEDYVSLSTLNDYPDVDMDYDDPIVQEILEFFSQIFPDEELKEYALLLFSSFLQGTNPEEKFHVFTGVGGNGKSKLIELFEMAIGEYGFKFPITLITQKRASSGAANPEVARTKGRRFGIFQEPDEGEKINVGLMKEFTGGDSIIVRPLYCEPFQFKPQFKLTLCCNHKPKIPSDDEGTWRRMSVLEYRSKFRKNPDPANPYEFARDDQLSQKLIRWKEMFMVVLLEKYKQYKITGLVEPPMVKNATLEYQKDSDIYQQFVDDTFTKDAESSVKLEESYGIFKSWYMDNITGKPPNRRDYKANVSRKLCPYNSRLGWVGYKLSSADDDDEPTLDVLKTPTTSATPQKKTTLSATPKKKIMITATPKKKSTIRKN